MAPRKNEWVKALGTMFEIFKALINEVISQGGNENYFRVILKYPEAKSLIAKKVIEVWQKFELLKFIGKVKIKSTEGFTAKYCFVADITDSAIVKISNIKTFIRQFSSKVEPAVKEVELSYYELTDNATDEQIIKNLGGKAKAKITLYQLWELLLLQPNGEEGALLVDRYNLLFIEDANNVIYLIRLYWDSYGWDLDAISMNSNSYNKYPIISGSPYENSNYLNTYRIFSANPCHLDDGNRLGQLPRYLGASQKGKDKIIINVNRSFVHKSIDGRLAYPEFNESGPSEYDLHSLTACRLGELDDENMPPLKFLRLLHLNGYLERSLNISDAEAIIENEIDFFEQDVVLWRSARDKPGQCDVPVLISHEGKLKIKWFPITREIFNNTLFLFPKEAMTSN
ncbi:hypothetical protein HOE31_04680 [bacterium]|jgi:hypothetical protein|nr:hypothetical protein [bacterium]MBT4122215.1 hypothetical protein [bacterium]MBT4335697.1 hypothetical protein [bacterium]MBT4495885.1 hypothetical protein [bacterium]MBT4763945.1 hypothetical protein [bacterium]